MKKLVQILLVMFLVTACSSKQVVTSKPRPNNAPGAVAPDDSKVMVLFMKATQARLLGDGSKAIHLFEQTLKLDPNNAAALFELSKLQNGNQQPAAALINAKKAAALDKSNIWYQFLLADMYKQAGELENAVKVYDRILESHPQRYEVYLSKAELLSRSGNTSEVDKVYDTIIEKFGWSDEIMIQRYTGYMQNGEYDKAMNLADKALESRPNDLRYLSMKAEVHQYRNEMDEAQAIYTKILEKDPSNSNVRIAMAEHYYSKGEPSKAVEQLEAAFRDPNLDVDAKMQVLLGFYDMSQRTDLPAAEREDMVNNAYGLIDLLKEQHPGEGKPYTIHGDFLMRDSKFEEARNQFRQAVKYEKDRFAIWQQLVLLDSRLSDSEGMLQDASEAVELFPTQPIFYLFKGVAENQLDKHDDAVESLVAGKNLVVDDDATKAQFLSSMGDVYNALEEFELSDRSYEEALKLNPMDAGVMNNYAYYLSERNENLERAQELSKKSNEIIPNNASYEDTYAWILYQAGKYTEARTWIEKAMKNGGAGEGVLNEHYGDILFKLGETDMALEKWKLARTQGGGSDLLEKKISEGKLIE